MKLSKWTLWIIKMNFVDWLFVLAILLSYSLHSQSPLYLDFFSCFPLSPCLTLTLFLVFFLFLLSRSTLSWSTTFWTMFWLSTTTLLQCFWWLVTNGEWLAQIGEGKLRRGRGRKKIKGNFVTLADMMWAKGQNS